MVLWHLCQHVLNLCISGTLRAGVGHSIDFGGAGQFGDGHTLSGAFPSRSTCALSEDDDSVSSGLDALLAVGDDDFGGALHHVVAEGAGALDAFVVTHDGVGVIYLGVDFHFRLGLSGHGDELSFCEVPVLLGVNVAEGLAEVLRKLDSTLCVAVVIIATACHHQRHHRCGHEE